MAGAPTITRMLETALYVDDIERATAFYRDVMGFRVLDAGPRLVALDAGQGTLLLLFRRGATVTGAQTPGGWIPPHDGTGDAHIAFAVPADDLARWESQLSAHGVAIESRVSWGRGGRSIYFRDPDGHSLELATPGTWPTY
ncbi:MAG TPA: VOC family protein [Gemmatimonadaceae bacterium]|nr:VOC family protein [Gemmatimonadaceae bacterium]